MPRVKRRGLPRYRQHLRLEDLAVVEFLVFTGATWRPGPGGDPDVRWQSWAEYDAAYAAVRDELAELRTDHYAHPTMHPWIAEARFEAIQSGRTPPTWVHQATLSAACPPARTGCWGNEACPVHPRNEDGQPIYA